LPENSDSPTIAASDSQITEWLVYHEPDASYPELVQTTADGAGNLYVLFWSDQWTNYTDAQLGIFKYDASGSSLWETFYPQDRYTVDDPFGNNIRRYPLMIADSEGNLYISAPVQDDSAGLDILSLKFHSTGELAWEQHYTSDGLDIPVSITLDGDSTFYVTGQSDGSDQILLASTEGAPGYFNYSRDGQYICFDAPVGSRREVFLMQADGSNVTQLTTAGGYSPVLQPRE
ncbi:hypothetical protein ACFL5M_04735, partial [Candidatus Neomarinimicrobiota bacterium]